MEQLELKQEEQIQERKLPKMSEREQQAYRKYAIVRYIRKRISMNKNFLAMFTGQTGCMDYSTIIKGQTMNLGELYNSGQRLIDTYSLTKKDNVSGTYYPIKSKSEIISSGKKEVYEIELENGKKVLATSEHRFFKQNKKIFEEKELKDLKVGDSIRDFPEDYIKNFYDNANKRSNQMYSSKIKSIKKIGIVDTYDLHTPKYHNFFLDNGILSHNSGKSWSALSVAEMLNEDFNIARLVFKGKDLMRIINLGEHHYRKGIVIVWDEAGIDLSNRNWYSITNKVLSFLVQTFRHKNIILFFTVPYDDFVDSATKKLFHAQFETCGIDLARQTVSIKPKFLQYNAERKKWYRKYLKVRKGNGSKRQKIRRWNVPKPSPELVNAYEEKKNEFTKILNGEIETALNQLEGTNTNSVGAKKPALTEHQRRMVEYWKIGITDPRLIAKCMGMEYNDASRQTANLFKKGYNHLAFKSDPTIDMEYVKANKKILIEKVEKALASIPSHMD